MASDTGASFGREVVRLAAVARAMGGHEVVGQVQGAGGLQQRDRIVALDVDPLWYKNYTASTWRG
jgi:hypothetical protein